MPKVFDDDRAYVLGDQELDLLGNREKLAQWRHKNMGPPYFRLGRKIVYYGSDLNSWLASHRFEPGADGEA